MNMARSPLAVSLGRRPNISDRTPIRIAAAHHISTTATRAAITRLRAVRIAEKKNRRDMGVPAA
jgi:hypothetical protein